LLFLIHFIKYILKNVTKNDNNNVSLSFFKEHLKINTYFCDKIMKNRIYNNFKKSEKEKKRITIRIFLSLSRKTNVLNLELGNTKKIIVEKWLMFCVGYPAPGSHCFPPLLCPYSPINPI